MLERNIVTQQRVLEGEGAPKREGDQIVAPVFGNVVGHVDFRAVAKHAVARHVSADVYVIAKRAHKCIASIADTDDRAGLWIALAKSQKVESKGLWQDRKIALQLSSGQPRGVTIIAPLADCHAYLARRQPAQVLVLCRVRRHPHTFQSHGERIAWPRLYLKLSFWINIDRNW